MGSDRRSRIIAGLVALAVHGLFGAFLLWSPRTGGRTQATPEGRPVFVTLVSLNAQTRGVQASPRAPDRPPLRPSNQPAPTTPTIAPTQSESSPTPSAIAEVGPTGQAALQAPAGKDVEIYQAALLNYIERYRGYPEAARRSHVEGVVMLRFAMDRQGHVLEAWVDQSSGFMALDTEAVATVWRAQPLPVIPASLPARLSVVLPVSFSLR